MAASGNGNEQVKGLLPDDEEGSGDAELAALLTSALDDFGKQSIEKPAKQLVPDVPAMPSASSQGEDRGKEAAFDPSMMHEVDDIFKNMLSQDPLLKEHWEKLAESCSQAAQHSGDEDFEKSLQQTLKKMSENVQSLPSDSDIPEEELAKIWSNMGMSPENMPPNGMLPDIMPLVTNMMQNLLSKDILYPALKDLTDKYPLWLDQNKSALPEDDVRRYEKQLLLMREVCDHFEAESADDSESTKKDRFQQILTTMQKMQECGSPPKDLVGEVPDMGSPELDFSKIPGFNPAGSQCSIQ